MMMLTSILLRTSRNVVVMAKKYFIDYEYHLILL